MSKVPKVPKKHRKERVEVEDASPTEEEDGKETIVPAAPAVKLPRASHSQSQSHAQSHAHPQPVTVKKFTIALPSDPKKRATWLKWFSDVKPILDEMRVRLTGGMYPSLEEADMFPLVVDFLEVNMRSTTVKSPHLTLATMFTIVRSKFPTGGTNICDAVIAAAIWKCGFCDRGEWKVESRPERMHLFAEWLGEESSLRACEPTLFADTSVPPKFRKRLALVGQAIFGYIYTHDPTAENAHLFRYEAGSGKQLPGEYVAPPPPDVFGVWKNPSIPGETRPPPGSRLHLGKSATFSYTCCGFDSLLKPVYDYYLRLKSTFLLSGVEKKPALEVARAAFRSPLGYVLLANAQQLYCTMSNQDMEFRPPCEEPLVAAGRTAKGIILPHLVRAGGRVAPGGVPLTFVPVDEAVTDYDRHVFPLLGPYYWMFVAAEYLTDMETQLHSPTGIIVTQMARTIFERYRDWRDVEISDV